MSIVEEDIIKLARVGGTYDEQLEDPAGGVTTPLTLDLTDNASTEPTLTVQGADGTNQTVVQSWARDDGVTVMGVVSSDYWGAPAFMGFAQGDTTASFEIALADNETIGAEYAWLILSRDSGKSMLQLAAALGQVWAGEISNSGRSVVSLQAPDARLDVGQNGAAGPSSINLQVGASTPIAVKDSAVGFFNTTPVAKPTGVAVDAASIHAALVSLGLIAA